MLLLLLRHADAAAQAASDEARELTEKGRRQAQAVRDFCQQHGIAPDLVLTSPYVRARQTAKLVADEPLDAPWLASGMRPDDAIRELRAHEALESVMLVGHEPDFSELAARLLGLPSGKSIHLRKASLTALAIGELAPRGAALEFSVPVKLMPAT